MILNLFTNLYEHKLVLYFLTGIYLYWKAYSKFLSWNFEDLLRQLSVCFSDKSSTWIFFLFHKYRKSEKGPIHTIFYTLHFWSDQNRKKASDSLFIFYWYLWRQKDIFFQSPELDWIVHQYIIYICKCWLFTTTIFDS